MLSAKTFRVSIYIGTRSGYGDELIDITGADVICQKYCDEVGLGVTITKTFFIYTQGNEPGIIVGLINYPRFPTTCTQIEDHAVELGRRLARHLQQLRFSFVTDNLTYMFEKGIDY